MLQEIRRLSSTAVEYIPGEGAWCPVCARFGLGQHRLFVTSTHADGVKYTQCRNCNFSFKAIDKTPPSKSPEPLVLPAKKPQVKGRKRKK
jgi:hypothetical protein